ncbi:MAG: hypothetical protein OXG33_11910 [Chloroflexi bacterium]|nr:hypothetical protein [Chloroflexota bacterium]
MGDIGVWAVVVVILSAMFWLSVASLTHYIAQAKGRGSILWFIFGLFFPVLSLIVVVLMPARNSIVRVQLDDGQTVEGKVIDVKSGNT